MGIGPSIGSFLGMILPENFINKNITIKGLVIINIVIVAVLALINFLIKYESIIADEPIGL